MSCGNSNTNKENSSKSIKGSEYKEGLKYIADKNNVVCNLNNEYANDSYSKPIQHTYEIEDEISTSARSAISAILRHNRHNLIAGKEFFSIA